MERHSTDREQTMHSPSSSDEQLVMRVLDGERSAFDELVTRYQRQATAVSYRLLNNVHDAQEVTQDAFIKAFTSLHTLQKPQAFGGWLMRIVSNLSLNFRRGRKTRQQLPLDDVLGADGAQEADLGGTEARARAGDPVRRLQSHEMGQQLQQAMEQLPEKQRFALTMFTLDQMPQKQVADALGCSVEAVKWHVFQGRKKLKDLLKDYL